MPALIAVVLIEFIPLRDPRDGWKANQAAWAREILTSSVFGVGLIVQTCQLLPQVMLTRLQILCIALLASVGTTLPQIWVANHWIYPIPFGFILAGPVYFGILFAILFVFVRRHLQDPAFVHALRHQVYVLVIQCFFAIVYCAVCTLYYHVTPSNQPLIVLGLPVIKFTMQQTVAWASSYIGEYMPGITVFTVEVFNALYVAKCMQNAGSPITSILLIALDIFHGIRSFRRINSRMSQLSRLIGLKHNSTLFQHVIATCRHPNVLSSASETLHDIRVRSPLQLQLSESGANVIHQLEQYQARPSTEALKASGPTLIPPFQASGLLFPQEGAAQLLKQPHSKNITSPSQMQSLSLASTARKQELVHQALKLLFQCEYHALVEYIECVIPVVYTVYVAVLCQLPSSRYHPETMHLTTARIHIMVSNVLVYACWEMLSLVALHFAVRWRFRFSLLQLLAFSLQSRFMEFEGRLVAIFCYVFSCTLVHYGKQLMRMCALHYHHPSYCSQCGFLGVDFTLRFEWESQHT